MYFLYLSFYLLFILKKIFTSGRRLTASTHVIDVSIAIMTRVIVPLWDNLVSSDGRGLCSKSCRKLSILNDSTMS